MVELIGIFSFRFWMHLDLPFKSTLGFIEKKRVGRRNIYTVNEAALFSYPLYGTLNVAQMITALRRLREERKAAAT